MYWFNCSTQHSNKNLYEMYSSVYLYINYILLFVGCLAVLPSGVILPVSVLINFV